MTKTPAMFIGHGSPMNAIQDNKLTKSWQHLGKTLPKPRAILVISAHWYAPELAITSQKINPTIHDFYGFPEKLATYEYPSIGSPEIAQEICSLIGKEVMIAQTQHARGLDHGAWSILTHMYPKPDIPILQLSIDSRQNNEWHYNLGQKLAILRQYGIMVISSGNIVHNLSLLSWDRPDYGADFALEFDVTVSALIRRREFTSLIKYHSVTQNALKAVPTPEHYLPLLYILGMADNDDKLTIFNQIYQYGSLSMTSILID